RGAVRMSGFISARAGLIAQDQPPEGDAGGVSPVVDLVEAGHGDAVLFLDVVLHLHIRDEVAERLADSILVTVLIHLIRKMIATLPDFLDGEPYTPVKAPRHVLEVDREPPTARRYSVRHVAFSQTV
ncbi:MAG: hypothetical protein ACOYL3_26520, partial [Desulfuromonadaceae bacterium]